MKKYEEEHYQFENIKEHIYPWIRKELKDKHALNGKNLSEKDTLAPGTDIEALYHTACENLARDVEFVIGNTWYGAFGIIADGFHEASSLCFKHIWQVCVDKLKDDLVIMVPSKDTVLFAPAGQKEVVEKMIEHGKGAYDMDSEGISMSLMLFSQARKELTPYEA